MQNDKTLKWGIIIVVEFILLLFVFQLGNFVGFHKATHSNDWGDNYMRIFGDPHGGMMGDLDDSGYMNGYGIAGSVVKVESNDLIINGNNGVEQIVRVSAGTRIVNGNQEVKLSDLHPNDNIVIVGSPQTDGSVQAEIIRVMPAR